MSHWGAVGVVAHRNKVATAVALDKTREHYVVAIPRDASHRLGTAVPLCGESVDDVAIIVELRHKHVASGFLSVAIPPVGVVRCESQCSAVGAVETHGISILSCHIAVAAVVGNDVVDRDGIVSALGIVPGSPWLCCGAHVDSAQPLQRAASIDFHQHATVVAAVLLALKLPVEGSGGASSIGDDDVAGAHVVGVSHLGGYIDATVGCRCHAPVGKLTTGGVYYPLEVAVAVGLYHINIIIVACSLIGRASADLIAAIVDRESGVAELFRETTLAGSLRGAREHYIINGIACQRHVAAHGGWTCLKEISPTGVDVLALR